MGIDWNVYGKIRELHIKQGLSDREIARRLNVGRRTVKKYRDGAALPGQRSCPERSSEMLDKLEPEILRMLEENRELPKKQRYSAHDMWRYFVADMGVAVGESTVRKYVRDLRDAHKEEFLPLSYEPGETVQFDWGDNYAFINGVKVAVSTLCAALPHSGAVFGFVYPDKTFVSFADGHIKTFEALGGTPRQATYDNLRTAVKNSYGKKAVKQDDFKRLESHYGVKAVFCNRSAGWEKSNVENAVAIVRAEAFVPIPRVGSFAELQEHVTNATLAYNRTHKIREHARSVWEDYCEERELLMPLPAVPLDIGETVIARVYTDQTVRYENVRYSVPHGFVGKEVTLRVSPFDIEIFHKGESICVHKRMRSKGEDQYIFEHYLVALERKPRAIDQAKPVGHGAIMPDQCRDFLRLCDANDAKRQLVEIMLMGREVGRERVLWALEEANKTLNPNVSLVTLYLQTGEPVGHAVPAIKVDRADLSVYDRLIGGAGDGE